MGKKEQPFFNPFSALKDKKAELEREAEEQKRPAKKVEAPKKEEPRPSIDAELMMFLEATRGSRPVGKKEAVQRPKQERPVRPRADDSADAESFAQMADLLDDGKSFDREELPDRLEATMHGLDRRILSRLKRGDYPVEARLDLHGLVQQKAKEQVERFLSQAREQKKRCVLIIHGRGLNSEDQIPVLKRGLVSWLEQGKSRAHILAFCSAQAHDGGTGAVYVLLRRPPPGRGLDD